MFKSFQTRLFLFFVVLFAVVQVPPPLKTTVPPVPVWRVTFRSTVMAPE